jgi:hypothetical protein
MAYTAPVQIIQPFASAGDVTPVPQTDPNAFVNFQQGYTPNYEINLQAGNPAAKAVERPIQNWLFNIITANLQQYQQFGIPMWYSGVAGGYAKNAQVLRQNVAGDLVPYRSLVNANVSDPLTNAVNWEYMPYAYEAKANIPMPSGGSAGPSGAPIAAAVNFNNMTTGTYWIMSDAVAAASSNAPSQIAGTPVAGVLEVLVWVGTSNTFIIQRYLDRNAQMYVRAATNGAWTAWRNFFTQSAVFALNEIKIWSGNPANIPTTWGPGWHLCDGSNGTVDLRGKFVIGAGGSYANGAIGGAATATLATANLPAHGHPVTINDPTHTHTINQTPHGHGISDPGHAHSVYDPTHTHGMNDPGHNHGVNDPGHAHGVGDNGHSHSLPNLGSVQAGADNGGAQSPVSTGYSSGRTQAGTNSVGTGIWIGGAATGIYLNASGTGTYLSYAATGVSIYGNGTGVGVVAQYANVSNAAAATGISASAGNTGSGTPVAILPPYFALCFVQYTGT